MKQLTGYVFTSISSFAAGLFAAKSFRWIVLFLLGVWILKSPIELVSSFIQKQIDLTERRMEIDRELELKRLDFQHELDIHAKEGQ